MYTLPVAASHHAEAARRTRQSVDGGVYRARKSRHAATTGDQLLPSHRSANSSTPSAPPVSQALLDVHETASSAPSLRAGRQAGEREHRPAHPAPARRASPHAALSWTQRHSQCSGRTPRPQHNPCSRCTRLRPECCQRCRPPGRDLEWPVAASGSRPSPSPQSPPAPRRQQDRPDQFPLPEHRHSDLADRHPNCPADVSPRDRCLLVVPEHQFDATSCSASATS
jgi:hypothetical protein